MAQLTLITHVYNAQGPIDRQIERWKRFSPDLLSQLQFLIIDDHSDEPLKIDPGPLDLRLLRVDDDIDWNMPGCRNLAAIQSRTEWMLYFDADNIGGETAIAKLVGALPRLDPLRLHVFRRVENGVDVEPHINTFLITRRGFFQAGGYDEDFCGHYGYEDVVFRTMWRKYVGSELMFTDIAFEQIGFRTAGLNRDTTHNQALANFKQQIGLPKPRALVRFAWNEVNIQAQEPAEVS